jgi:hypothetical protein
LTVPFRFAAVCPTPVARVVETSGSFASVVNVLSPSQLVPAELVAHSRKW